MSSLPVFRRLQPVTKTPQQSSCEEQRCREHPAAWTKVMNLDRYDVVLRTTETKEAALE